MVMEELLKELDALIRKYETMRLANKIPPPQVTNVSVPATQKPTAKSA